MDFKLELGKAIGAVVGMEAEEVSSWMEVPPESAMGDYAFPCFRLAKTMRKAPPMIAAELAQQVEKPDFVERVEVKGAYLNFFLDKATVQMWAIEQAFEIEFPTRRTRSTSASRCNSPPPTIRRSTLRRKPTERAGRRRSRRPRACGASATSTTSARRSARGVSPRSTA